LSARRIEKAPANKPRILLGCFKYKEDAHALLRVAKHLKNNAIYPSVYISPDRSPAEQDHYKKLRAEVKARRDKGENVFLRGDRICQGDGKNRFDNTQLKQPFDSSLQAPLRFAVPSANDSSFSLRPHAVTFVPSSVGSATQLATVGTNSTSNNGLNTSNAASANA
jgi:hypothetical protein